MGSFSGRKNKALCGKMKILANKFIDMLKEEIIAKGRAQV